VVCTGPIAETPVGWTHVDIRGVLIGWLCPMPHMSLARPRDLTMGADRDLKGAAALLTGAVPVGGRHGNAPAYSGI
jgi:hypothetical protein